MGKSGSGGGGLTLEARRKALDVAIERGDFRVVKIPLQVVEYIDGSTIVKYESSDYPDFTGPVNKGAALLDEVDPGWYEDIKIDALNLDDENMCVLGQSWNHYKKVENALAGQIQDQYGYETNFVKFLKALHLKGKIDSNATSTQLKRAAADYGFAFATEVYYWAHLEHKRRMDAGTMGLYGDDGRHGTWTIDAELWEHLTKTWLVVIEARQKAKAKAKKEEQRTKNEVIGKMTTVLQNRGMEYYAADRLAKEMYDQGKRTIP